MNNILKRLSDILRNRRTIDITNMSPKEAVMPIVERTIKQQVPEIKTAKPLIPPAKQVIKPTPVSTPSTKTSPDGFYGQGARDFSNTVKKLKQLK